MKLFSTYGQVEECKPMDAEDCEPYTDVYRIKFYQFNNASSCGGSGGGDDGRDWKNDMQARLMLETMQKSNVDNKGKKVDLGVADEGKKVCLPSKGSGLVDGTNKTMGKKRTASGHPIQKLLAEPYQVRELKNNIPDDSPFHPNEYPSYCRKSCCSGHESKKPARRSDEEKNK
ncbi:hypothetical protein OROGR_010131 [Orobanche gracilis]